MSYKFTNKQKKPIEQNKTTTNLHKIVASHASTYQKFFPTLTMETLKLQEILYLCNVLYLFQ